MVNHFLFVEVKQLKSKGRRRPGGQP